MTVLAAAALTVALSLAPLPDAWRPLPGLATASLATSLQAILLPSRSSGPAAARAPTFAAAPSQPTPAPPPARLLETPSAQPSPSPSPAPEPAPDPARPMDPVAGPAQTLGAADRRAARDLEVLRALVSAAHVDLEQGCLETAPEGCRRRALEPLFAALEAGAAGTRRAPVRVEHLGTSLIASDHITDVIRRRLELRFGSGGKGFLFVDRPTRLSGRTVRTGQASDAWEISKLTDKPLVGPLGLSGVRFDAHLPPQTTSWAVDGARTAELFFLTRPDGGFLTLHADDKPLTSLLTVNRREEAAFARVSLPPGTAQLHLRTRGRVGLFGVSLENGRPGVIYDSIGIPGASAEVFLRADPRLFATQLAHRTPSLVVLMLGGTEAYELGRDWTTLEKVREALTGLVDRVQAAVPASACLLIGPLDAGVATVAGEVTPREQTAGVATVVREVALARGCGFWDAQAAMGGAGAVVRWKQAGLMSDDLVHPTTRGADLLGHLFDFALERARQARPGAPAQPAEDPPGLFGPQALARTFGKLAEAEQRRGPPVSIVQLGASHTASHRFTDPARAELVRRFGATGRGFIAAGRASPQLARGGVKRALSGEWLVTDARGYPPGRRWGLTGIRAEGQPGASFSVAFPPSEDPGAPTTASVHYLAGPEQGRLEVLIDDVPVGLLPPEGARPMERAARVATYAVSGRAQRVKVRVLGPAPASLFGVALDLTRPGVRYDALGLPGSTAMLADGYDKATLTTALESREADLYVLFWGTNESAIAGLDPSVLRAHYVSLLGTLRAASPQADCLVLGPTDRMHKAEGGGWREAPSTSRVVSVLREVAAAEGCAFWSPRAAMGGPRSMLRWQSVEPPLGHPDGVHLTAAGYEALSHAFVDDLLEAYARRDPAGPAAVAQDAGPNAAGAR